MRKKVNFAFRLFNSHLDDGERILDIAHRHFFVLAKDSFKSLFFGLILPATLYFFLPEAWLLVLIWVFIGFVSFSIDIFDWYFDAWLITNVGIIDVERNGLFERNSTRVDYHMIEGLSYSINGFWPTVLGYGDITLDKLGVQTALILHDANNPRDLERKILHYQEKFVTNKSIRDHNALKDMLSQMIAYHVQSEKISNE